MIRSIEDLELRGKVTFIRVDFNVPLIDGKVGDDTRIKAALPTIDLARKNGARVVLASHLGRPGGEADPELSLLPVGEHLAGLLDHQVVFADDCVGDGVKKNLRDLREGDVLLLENVRFHAEEKNNDEEFARALADGVDVYVNDAFGTAHRAHASTAGMARFVRDKGVGLLMKRELDALGGLVKDPKRPFVAVVGGAKVSDKLGVLENLVKICDAVLIGGAMAYTFLAARGTPVGKSRVERDKIPVAEQVLKSAAGRKVPFLLPVDHVCAESFDEDANPETVTEIRDDLMGLDIGPKSRELFRNKLIEAKTIFWNGPMGVFEWESFAGGTEAVARSVADNRGVSVIGGGDSVAAINKMGLQKSVTHISTGGGASLKLVEGKKLPGMVALEE